MHHNKDHSLFVHMYPVTDSETHAQHQTVTSLCAGTALVKEEEGCR